MGSLLWIDLRCLEVRSCERSNHRLFDDGLHLRQSWQRGLRLLDHRLLRASQNQISREGHLRAPEVAFLLFNPKREDYERTNHRPPACNRLDLRMAALGELLVA